MAYLNAHPVAKPKSSIGVARHLALATIWGSWRTGTPFTRARWVPQVRDVFYK